MMRYVWLLFLVACSHSPANPDPARYEQIIIVGTNDFHGYLRPVEADFHGQKLLRGGAEWFAGYVRILERKFGDRLVMLDGGDLFQGTMESNASLGKPVVRFYNMLPYRATAVGNHEFDYGPRRKGDPDRLGALKDRMAEAKFPFLQANIFWRKSGRLWRERNLFPTTVFTAGGFKIGVIGLTTTTTPAKTLPQNVAGLEFRDFVEPTRQQAAALRAGGVDLVLIATHEGGEGPNQPLFELLKALPKGTIDAVVAGHHHAIVHEFVLGVPMIQSSTRGLYFGRIDLFVDKRTRKVEPSLTRIHAPTEICGTWFARAESCDMKRAQEEIKRGARPENFLPLRPVHYEGEEVAAALDVRQALTPFFAAADKRKGEVLGHATRDFLALPSRETEVGTLFLDAYRWKFPYAKVAYTNGGGIRRLFTKGPLTYGDLFEVHPFDNFAVAVKLNGRQFRQLVEVGLSGAQSIPIVSGVRIKYHAHDAPTFERDLNGDGKKETWERNRVASLAWEDGRPVRDHEEFWVATNDYLVSGGDNAEHIFGGLPASRKRYIESTQRDMVADYLRAHKGLRLPPTALSRIEALP
jgi:5'-nucleotidase